MPVELFGNLTNKVFKLVDKLGGTVDFVDLMTRFTLDAIGLAGFGMIPAFNNISFKTYSTLNRYFRI